MIPQIIYLVLCVAATILLVTIYLEHYRNTIGLPWITWWLIVGMVVCSVFGGFFDKPEPKVEAVSELKLKVDAWRNRSIRSDSLLQDQRKRVEKPQQITRGISYFPEVPTTLYRDIVISLETEPEKWELAGSVKGHGDRSASLKNGAFVLSVTGYSWLSCPVSMTFQEGTHAETIRNLVIDRVGQLLCQEFKEQKYQKKEEK